MRAFSIQNALSLVITAAFIAALAAWMVAPPPELNPTAMTVINMLLGALVAKFTTIVDYHFGSSRGSQTKDETIARLSEPAPSNGTVIVPPTNP